VLFAAFVIAQVWNGINCRALDGTMPPFFQGNPIFFVVMGVIVATQVLIVQYGGVVFNTVPLSIEQWARIFLMSASVLVVGFVIRAVFRHPVRG
jgi:Ca2+-transporting ATPase